MKKKLVVCILGAVLMVCCHVISLGISANICARQLQVFVDTHSDGAVFVEMDLSTTIFEVRGYAIVRREAGGHTRFESVRAVVMVPLGVKVIEAAKKSLITDREDAVG